MNELGSTIYVLYYQPRMLESVSFLIQTKKEVAVLETVTQKRQTCKGKFPKFGLGMYYWSVYKTHILLFDTWQEAHCFYVWTTNQHNHYIESANIGMAKIITKQNKTLILKSGSLCTCLRKTVWPRKQLFSIGVFYKKDRWVHETTLILGGRLPFLVY